jgi:hypothetical protein
VVCPLLVASGLVIWFVATSSPAVVPGPVISGDIGKLLREALSGDRSFDSYDVSGDVERVLLRLPESIDLPLSHPKIVEGVQPLKSPAPVDCGSLPILAKLMKWPRLRLLECLWTARDFNPNGVEITAAQRVMFIESLAPYLRAATELGHLASNAAMKEFRHHVKQRSPALPFISRRDYIERAKKRAPRLLSKGEHGLLEVSRFVPSIAFDFDANLTREVEGGWCGARMLDMPAARPAYEAMAFTSHELARSAVEFALTFGAISLAEADRMRERAAEIFESMTQ